MRLTLDGVAKSFGAETVLEQVTVTLGTQSRAGVVGPNGAGKSTLLRLIAGLEQPDAGRVELAPTTLTVGYRPQEADIGPDESLLGYFGRSTGVSAAERELAREARRLATEPAAADAYASALNRFLALGGGDLEHRAAAACSELRLPLELQRTGRTLSGGQAARAGLAAVLLPRFDMLLLDEPTNDLDFDGLETLERFVDGFGGGLVVVSHDRAFLDRTVTRILEIDPWTHRVNDFAGGWNDYERRRELERKAQFEAFDRAAERRREIDALLGARRSQARAGARLGKRTGGADRRATRALSGKVRQARRALERVDQVEKPYEPWELRLTLEARQRPGDLVLRLEGAVATRGRFRLGPVDVDLAPGERMSVTGPNGSGKSTLLALMLGELPLVGGRRLLGSRTQLAAMGQARLAYGGAETLLAAYSRRAGAKPTEARTLLAKFGLGADDVDRACRSLSPG